MTKINLEEILDKELRTVSLLSKDLDVDKVLLFARKAMKEACRQTLLSAKDNIKYKIKITKGKTGLCNQEMVLDEEAFMNLLNEIE